MASREMGGCDSKENLEPSLYTSSDRATVLGDLSVAYHCHALAVSTRQALPVHGAVK